MLSFNEKEWQVQVQTCAVLLQLQKREILQKHLKSILKNNKKSLSSSVPPAPFLPVFALLGAPTTTSASVVSPLLSSASLSTASGAICSLAFSSCVALHVLVQGEGLGEEGRGPVEGGVWLLREEGVCTCCLIPVHVIELMKLMAAHITLRDHVEIPGG